MGKIGGPVVAVVPRRGGQLAKQSAVTARKSRVDYAVSAASGYYWSAWVYCPSGMKVTNGGLRVEDVVGVQLKASQAIDGGAGWQVTIANYSSVPRWFDVVAMCFSGLSNYHLQTDTRTMAPGEAGLGVAFCGTGRVLGGGAWSDTFDVGFKSSMPYGDGGWWASLRNRTANYRPVTAQAICADGVQNYGLIYSPSESVPPGGDRLGAPIAKCPGGTLVIGGGGQGGLITEHADVYGEGWQIVMINENPSTGSTIQTAAVCGL